MALELKWLKVNDLMDLTYEFIGRDWFLETQSGLTQALSEVFITIQGIWWGWKWRGVWGRKGRENKRETEMETMNIYSQLNFDIIRDLHNI